MKHRIDHHYLKILKFHGRSLEMSAGLPKSQPLGVSTCPNHVQMICLQGDTNVGNIHQGWIRRSAGPALPGFRGQMPWNPAILGRNPTLLHGLRFTKCLLTKGKNQQKTSKNQQVSCGLLLWKSSSCEAVAAFSSRAKGRFLAEASLVPLLVNILHLVSS